MESNLLPPLIAILILLSIIIAWSIDQYLYKPLRAEDALHQCMTRNFTYADSYVERPFDAKAYGVKCKYASKYILEGDSGIIAVNGEL